MLRFFDQLTETKWNYVASFIADTIAVFALMLTVYFTYRGEAAGWYLLAMVAGIVTWTLYEYVFHRWIFHGSTPLAAGHSKHHNDVDRLLSMPFLTGPAIYAVIFFSLRILVNDGLAAAYTTAYAISYLYYGFLHHSSHFMEIDLKLWKKMRAHHLLHHKFPDRNFGFTTSIWDRVFGTHYAIQKPRRTGTSAPQPIS
ncbi:MAG: sterol desaturase family protein [Spirochaetia bacterium]|nr:sterol desaturase family protein [Spirochaetia bacterium]